MKDCSICAHSQLEDINRDILKGVSVRKIAEKYGVTKSSVYRHQLGHIGTSETGQVIRIMGHNLKRDTAKLYRDTNVNLTGHSPVTESKCNDTKCNDKNSTVTPPTVSHSQALDGHWKVIEEDGKVTLYFKKQIIPLEPFGNDYHDPKSKEEFKKDGNNWFLRIPYYKGEWLNLDNVACFYE